MKMTYLATLLLALVGAQDSNFQGLPAPDSGRFFYVNMSQKT